MTPEPVVVLATPHSDAAYVAALIGGHPRAVFLPELKLFSAASVAELLSLYEHGDTRGNDGLLRAIAWLFCGSQHDTDIIAAQRFLEHRRGWSTAALVDWIIERVAPKTAVFHDISAPLHIIELDRWLDNVPDAAFIHLLRNPAVFVQTARRIVEKQLYIPPDYSSHGDHPRLDPQVLWFRVHDTLTREFNARPQIRTRRLLLEDLHAGLETALAQLCAWLDWPADDIAIRHMCATDRTAFSAPGPAGAPAGIEAPFLREPQFATPLGAHPRDGTLRQVELAPDVVACAMRYGYR